MNVKFSPPDVGEAEIDEVASALRSGWITTGPKTKELERKIAQSPPSKTLQYLTKSRTSKHLADIIRSSNSAESPSHMTLTLTQI